MTDTHDNPTHRHDQLEKRRERLEELLADPSNADPSSHAQLCDDLYDVVEEIAYLEGRFDGHDRPMTKDLIAYRVRKPGPPDENGRIVIGYTEAPYREKVTALPDGSQVRVEYNLEARYADRNLHGGIGYSGIDDRMLQKALRRRENLRKTLAGLDGHLYGPRTRERQLKNLAKIEAKIAELEESIAQQMDGDRQRMRRTHQEMRRTQGASAKHRGTESFRPVPEPGEVL